MAQVQADYKEPSRDLSKWYEHCIQYLAQQSGFQTQAEPFIKGQTPDLKICRPDEPDIIVECLIKTRDSRCEKLPFRKGHHPTYSNISEAYGTLYARLEQKATKYRDILGDMPYILALYDDECVLADDDKAFQLAFSAHHAYITMDINHQVIDKGYTDEWSGTETASIFEKHPQVSGIIYSYWPAHHQYLPNPFATTPAPTCLFPFAHMPEAPNMNGAPAWQERIPTIDDDYYCPPNTWRGQVERLSHAINALANHRREPRLPAVTPRLTSARHVPTKQCLSQT